MWLDALALVLLGIFTLMGAMRGALASGLSLFTLAAAYVGAILLGPRVGPGVAQSFNLPAMLGTPIGGAMVFLGVFLACCVSAGVFAVSALGQLRCSESQGLSRWHGLTSCDPTF